MRIAVFSDLHANADALAVLGEEYDELWFLGDIVGYGPDVATAIDFVRQNGSIAIRGNHDNAAVYDDPIGCSPQNEPLALATRDYTRDRLDAAQRDYLATLALEASVTRGGSRFYLTHGSPRDPLYEYVRPSVSDQDLEAMTRDLNADIVLLGHTHLPMLRQIGSKLVVNPGSLGQPRDGDWRSAYLIWEDGTISEHRAPYDRSHFLDKVATMPIQPHFRLQLRDLMENARVPERTSRTECH